MNTNFLLEIILILLAILASNGIIYILPFINLNKKNFGKNISVLRNSSEKDVLGQTFLIASNPLSLTSSESSASQTLSTTSSETYVSQDFIDLDELDLQEVILAQSNHSILSNTNEVIMAQSANTQLSPMPEGMIFTNINNSDQFTTLDSITILNSQTIEE